MEAISHYKHYKNPRISIHQTLISHSSENFAPLGFNHQQQPPLLPLPVWAKPYCSLPPRINKGVLNSPINRNPNSRISKPRKPKSPISPKGCGLSPEGTMAKVNGSDNLAISVDIRMGPEPSCLPLPKFSLKPKVVSCNVQAGGVDDGATDNLRRLLRL